MFPEYIFVRINIPYNLKNILKNEKYSLWFFQPSVHKHGALHAIVGKYDTDFYLSYYV